MNAPVQAQPWLSVQWWTRCWAGWLAPFYDLTPAGDPTEAFVRFTGGDYFKAPAVDAVWVRSWTGAGDYGEPPTVADDLAAASAWPDVGLPAEEGAEPEWAAEAAKDDPAAGWGQPIVR